MKISPYLDGNVSNACQALLGSFGNEQSTARALAADVVRSLVDTCDGTLRSLAITNRLRETLVPLWPELDTVDGSMRLFGSKDWELTVLNALGRLGDIINYDGSWRPVPWRLISLGTNCPYALLCGTVGLEEISPSMKIKTHGYLRIASLASLPKALQAKGERWQGALDWLRLEERSIEKWTAEWLDKFGSECAAGEPLGYEDVQVFLPEIRAGLWRPLTALKTPLGGVRLCRNKGVMPFKPSYFLATLGRRLDGLSIKQSFELPLVVGSRLSFGLCLQRNTRYKISGESRNGEILLRNVPLLPWPESTLFFTMIKDADEDGRRCYWIPEQLETLLSFVFEKIGIDIEMPGKVHS